MTRWDVERVYQRKRVDDLACRALVQARRKRWMGRVETQPAEKKLCEVPVKKPRHGSR